jgi:hypothetical protein
MSFLPLARVTGAAPGYTLSPRSSAKGVESSPISATRRAAASPPGCREAGEDGHLRMLRSDERSESRQWAMRGPVGAQNVGHQLGAMRSDLVRATLCRLR